jgi:hypothetical protein
MVSEINQKIKKSPPASLFSKKDMNPKIFLFGPKKVIKTKGPWH